jgi:exosortase
MEATALENSRGPATTQVQRVLQWLPWVAIVALLIGMYSKILAGLADDWWNDPNASHGLLVPPLAGYIAWQRRRLTFKFPVLPDLRGLSWIAGGCLLLFIGKLGAEFFLSRVSLVILLTGFVHTFWGKQRLQTLGFPLLLLATMVPMPVIVYNQLAQPLQLFASAVSTQIARLAGVSIFQEGNVIQLATTTLGVEEACSGLRSLSALVVMALLLGFLVCTRKLTRVLLLVLAVPIAIFVNVLRVSGTAILADYNPELAMGFYHTFSGWLIFLLGIALVYGACFILHKFLDRTA